MADIRSHPDYFTGFYDALDLTPLFDDASGPYKAGWHAAWEAKRIFEGAGFAQGGSGFTKTMTIKGGAA